MTLRIDKVPDGAGTTIRLIGRIRAELVEELKTQIAGSGKPVVLDLDEVSLVDVDAVRFLGECQAEGIGLIHCSPYINDWIALERGKKCGGLSDSAGD
jgi:anti-anti-sigma regulatory factor